MFRKTIDTTYADLRPSDLVIDKSGQAWPIAELEPIADMVIGPRVDFWLCDPVTKVKMHLVKKAIDDPVKVSRLPTQADEALKLEADFDVNRNAIAVAVTDEAPPLPNRLRPDYAGTAITDNFATTAEAVAVVQKYGIAAAEKIGVGATMAEAVSATGWTGESIEADAVANVMEYFKEATVEAEVTAAEVDAAAAATDDAPLTIIAFVDMTPLEQRSHLYLLHGVYGHDLQGKAELDRLHADAHFGHIEGTLNSRHVPHVHQEA